VSASMAFKVPHGGGVHGQPPGARSSRRAMP
jgi:hypothetical protein